MTSTASVSTEEREQILQTIEMFEVITQANPLDYQSLEILKEAYWKIGQQKEALAVTRRLADCHMALGQYSSALLEYEGILQKEPGNAEVLAMLGEVEAKLQGGQTEPEEPGAPDSPDAEGSSISLDFTAAIGEANLITTNATRKLEGARGEPVTFADDGNEPLAKFLIQHRLAPEEIVNGAVQRVQQLNAKLNGNAVATSLIDEIVKSRVADLDTLLCGILDRTKFAYVPIEYYDIDRQIVKMLPEALTLGRLIVPFDLVSRTVMIALANPFDALGKEAAQQLFDYNIQWHLAAPDALQRMLREAYRIE